MSADDQGNDLEAVGVPITGLAAFAPVDPANVIAEADLGAKPLVMPAGAKRLGLYKVDGGPQETRNSDDPIQLFQKGYQLAGDGSRDIAISVAEDNAYVMQLTEGIEPDANGVYKVSSSLPDNRFIFYVITKFKNGTEERVEGVATIKTVEPDQATRGQIRGKKVTFTWQEDDLFDGAPFWLWRGIPGSSAGKTGWNVTVSGTPTGGTYRLKLNGFATADLAYNANAAAVAAALNALQGVTGMTGITASGSGPIAVTLPVAGVLTIGTVALTGGTSPAVVSV